MNFEAMMTHLKNGERCARSVWNGKGMWIQIVPAGEWAVSSTVLPDPLTKPEWIGMCTATNDFIPWLASQADLLSDDWALASRSRVAPLQITPIGINDSRVMGQGQ